MRIRYYTTTPPKGLEVVEEIEKIEIKKCYTKMATDPNPPTEYNTIIEFTVNKNKVLVINAKDNLIKEDDIGMFVDIIFTEGYIDLRDYKVVPARRDVYL